MPRWRVPRAGLVGWWCERGVTVWLRNGLLHFVRYARNGHPIDALQLAAAGADGRGLLALVEGGSAEMLDKPKGYDDDQLGDRPLVDARAVREIPAIWFWLTATSWKDGTPKQRGRLSVFYEDGILKAMMKDRDRGKCCWVAGTSWHGLLGALEAALVDPEHRWRPDRYAGEENGRGRRKSA
jgi:hypothetical protein